MNIGIIGSGIVAKTLAKGFTQHGYSVKMDSRSPEKLDEFVSDNPKILVGAFLDAAQFSDVLVLAVKGSAALDALALIGAEALDNKTVIDTTNPIADAAPENGVLQFFTEQNDSLMEHLQQRFATTNFVKAFSSVGNAMMVNPRYKSAKPSMFICGNNDEAKSITTEILNTFGWLVEDMGKVEAARAIEPLCMLWCIKGFRENSWHHAFKLLND